MSTIRGRKFDSEIGKPVNHDVLDKLVKLGSIYWYDGMSWEEERKLAKAFGVEDLGTAFDRVDDAVLKHCKTVYRKSGDYDIVGFIVKAYWCPDHQAYVLYEILYEKGEGEQYRYTAYKSREEAEKELKLTLTQLADVLMDYSNIAEETADIYEGRSREEWLATARALEKMSEALVRDSEKDVLLKPET